MTFSGNLHSTMEWTNSRDGGTHAVVHVNAQNLTGIGSDGTQYQLPQNSAQETNVAIGTGQETTSVANLRVVSQGAAPNFEMLITLHLTVSASGQLNVQSDIEAGQCPG